MNYILQNNETIYDLWKKREALCNSVHVLEDAHCDEKTVDSVFQKTEELYFKMVGMEPTSTQDLLALLHCMNENAAHAFDDDEYAERHQEALMKAQKSAIAFLEKQTPPANEGTPAAA